MVSLFLLLGCNLSYIFDLFAALHELASASARTLLKLASSVRALLKPYGDTLNAKITLKTFTGYFVAYFVVFAQAPSTRSSRLLTSAVVLLSFAFFPRAQRGRDGQSPNQNLEKFSSFQFLNICT